MDATRGRALPVANISDSMARVTAGGARLRPMHAGGMLAGPALTVKSRPGDNLMLHKAIDLAEAGDVIVVDAGGDVTNSLMGELMHAYAEKKGVAGIVLYGAIRDYAYMRASKFPIFATGITHRGPYKDGPGEINVPIAIEGMVIHPGDLMVGDDDGVLCVPFDDCEAVYKATKAKNDAEARQMADILAGRNDRSWVDASLKKLGYSIEE
jgi:regulator of RNase E activity RraA